MIKPIEILLVEDNPGDVLLTKEALTEAKVYNNLHVVGDGDAALDFLNKQGEYTDVPRPELVLLDLNLPGRDGREVLAEIKESSELKTIPVVVLTTSTNEEDILRSYEYHANCYITKPLDLDQFVKVVRSIEDFWFSIVTLPK